MEYIIVFVSGMFFGIVIVLVIYLLRRKETKAIAQELILQTETRKIENLESVMNHIKESFGNLSLEAFSKNADAFLKLANETLSKQTQLGEQELEGKKRLIDKTLEMMKEDLKKVHGLVSDLEKDREKKFGELATQLKVTAEQTGKLQEVTGQLQHTLSNTKIRGQWGERMAEDVLRLAGFVEGINYQKQKSIEKINTRPDYTFLLPQGLKVNMDVKFPLDNYLNFLKTDGKTNQQMYKHKFLKDVRNRIKEVRTKDYINPGDNTVDYVMVFIPNEQVYSFIHDCDNTLLDSALKEKVILCSPITLYAVLAIIREAVDNFNLEKTASQILMLFGSFKKQWEAFIKSFEKMGKRIEEVQKEFYTLISTRRHQLERPLSQIDEIRKEKGISNIPNHHSGDTGKDTTNP